MFSISENLSNSTKIQQIENIEKILTSSKLDPMLKKKLVGLENKIIEKKHYKESFSELLSFIEENIKNPVTVNYQPTISEKTNPINDNSFLLHTLTSSWIIIIIMAMMLFIFLKVSAFTASDFAIIISGELTLLILVLLYSWAFSYLPKFENHIYNYILNSILHLFSIGLFVITFQLIDQRIKSNNLLKKDSHKKKA